MIVKREVNNTMSNKKEEAVEAKTPLEILQENFDNVTISQFGKDNFIQFRISEEMTIDENKLDYECATQAQFYATLSRAWARARYEAKLAKLDTQKAYAVAADFLRSPQGLAAQGKKATENSVAEAIDVQPEYINAQKRQIEAEFVADTLEGMLNSLRQKKAMLMCLKGISERE